MTYVWHVTLRRIERTHAIQRNLVELSVRTNVPITALQAIATVEPNWREPWRVVGIVRTI